jgi:hypothetical protein
MRKRWILLLLWVSALLPLAMHFWSRDPQALIHPFPFFKELAIHPQSWANLWLQRLRVFPLLIIIFFLVPKELRLLRGVVLSYLVFEGIDVADWFLRYGQDILAKGFDANVIKVTGVTVSIASFITHYFTHENDQ